MAERNHSVEELELDLFLEALFRHYGLDFRNYARPSLRRRVWGAVHAEGLATISELQNRVLHDERAIDRLVPHLSVSVTSMFRDPSFWHTLRETVVPTLRSYPFVRIWHAGCATGEEVYSMAILLSEEGLFEKCRLYATDMEATALEHAKSGIFSLELMQEYTGNYLKAGGKASFSEYYTAKYDYAIFRQSLKKHMIFSQHNLTSDASFNEFNVILCRNVLIYFNPTLQERVLGLFHESLQRRGVLALGHRETVLHTPYEHRFEELDRRDKIFKKVS